MRNVYDFDKTIYEGDSTIDFYLYCLKQYPFIIRWIPKQCCAFFLYKTKRITKTKMKEMFYSFFQDIRNIDLIVHSFWIKNENKVAKWYLRQKESTDLIISASPEFLLKPICEKLGISCLIASKVDNKTGAYNGENCYGEEKVRRFYAEYPTEKIKSFYSDSYSDTPLANLAEQAYLVRKNQLQDWKGKSC